MTSLRCDGQRRLADACNDGRTTARGERAVRGIFDAAEDGLEIVDDAIMLDAKYGPSELAKHAISSRIVARATLVGRAVDLDDEASLGAREVDDEGPDDELTSEGEAELGAGEASPQPLFGARWS